VAKRFLRNQTFATASPLVLTYLTSRLASVLGTDPLTLLTVAMSLDRWQPYKQLLKHLSEQGIELDLMGGRKKWPKRVTG
jgi:hypothetical protein